MENDRSYEIDIYENQSVYSEYHQYDENKKYFVNQDSNVRKKRGGRK